jgi:hypothetical protein
MITNIGIFLTHRYVYIHKDIKETQICSSIHYGVRTGVGMIKMV